MSSLKFTRDSNKRDAKVNILICGKNKYLRVSLAVEDLAYSLMAGEEVNCDVSQEVYKEKKGTKKIIARKSEKKRKK